MADPQSLARQAARIRRLYSGAELILMERVARRLARGITQPGWTEAKLAEAVFLQAELAKATAGLTPALNKELNSVLMISADAGVRSAINEAPVRGALGKTHIAAVQALHRQAMLDFSRSNLVILRRTVDAYRGVIAESSAMAVAGVHTRQQATQAALNRWAMQGIRGFTDKAGRRWDLGSYSEMATRSAITRSHLEGRMGVFDELGFETFIVSDHPNSCPVCADWAGQIVTKGHVAGYPTVDEARGSGLFHSNCGHTLNLYIEGAGMRTRDKVSYDPEGYALNQQQRGMERHVREWKRREAVAITPEAQAQARAKIREHQANLRAFTAQHDKPRLYYREQPRVGVVG